MVIQGVRWKKCQIKASKSREFENGGSNFVAVTTNSLEGNISKSFDTSEVRFVVNSKLGCRAYLDQNSFQMGTAQIPLTFSTNAGLPVEK